MTCTAAIIAGAAVAISGSTVKFNDGFGIAPECRTVRIWGIETIDKEARCKDDSGGVWRCGGAPVFMLNEVARHGISCRRKMTEPNGTVVAQCKFRGFDLGATMVAAGYAIDNPPESKRRFRVVEKYALRHRLGTWAGIEK